MGKKAKSFDDVLYVMMSDPRIFALVNRFLDSLQSINPYWMSYDLEYIARLASETDEYLARFSTRHKGNHRYMLLYKLAMDIRAELSSPKSNLNDWMDDYEAL